MIRSMTGYSSAQREDDGFSVGVNVKSLNHRYLDILLRSPAGAEPLEPLMRQAVKERVARGRVEVVVSIGRSGAVGAPINYRLLEAYAAACVRLREGGLAGAETDLASLLRLPGVIAAPNGHLPPEDFDRVRGLLAAALEDSLAALNAMRAREGEALERDLRARLARLGEIEAEIGRLAGRVTEVVRRRLEERVREVLGLVELDRSRLAQEVAYLASRSDIAEELTRFRSHLEQAAKLLDEGTEIGKKLDFLLQEMNREANTILSKNSDVPEVGMALGERAIEMKVEIERLREQAQNVE